MQEPSCRLWPARRLSDLPRSCRSLHTILICEDQRLQACHHSWRWLFDLHLCWIPSEKWFLRVPQIPYKWRVFCHVVPISDPIFWSCHRHRRKPRCFRFQYDKLYVLAKNAPPRACLASSQLRWLRCFCLLSQYIWCFRLARIRLLGQSLYDNWKPFILLFPSRCMSKHGRVQSLEWRPTHLPPDWNSYQ